MMDIEDCLKCLTWTEKQGDRSYIHRDKSPTYTSAGLSSKKTRVSPKILPGTLASSFLVANMAGT
jgi:hypothetical protein